MKAILITQCLQNDFVGPLDIYDSLPNLLHVGYDEAKRVLGENPSNGPISTVMNWAYSTDRSVIKIIHIRDWHNDGSDLQKDHLQQFGLHCIEGTAGAEFVFENSVPENAEHHVVNSPGLNDFIDTDLSSILNRYENDKINIGIIGVWTEAKVNFLAYELATRYPNFKIALCSALCASSSRSMHFIALDQMKNILGVTVFQSIGEFTKFLSGTVPEVVENLHPRINTSMIKIEDSHPLSDTDMKILLYLFRDCKELRIKTLDGGFSGNVVVKTKSVDLMGHEQVPCVVKIGGLNLIAEERHSFEKIQEVMGNNAPAIVDFTEYKDRGAIKYRYASMLSGEVKTFQDLYGEVSMEKIFHILDSVFIQQLGKLYRAKVSERLNLLEYYEFSSKYSEGIKEQCENLFGGVVDVDEELFAFNKKIKIPNVVKFYTTEIDQLKEKYSLSHYMAFLHGDLNGRNIIIDSQDNIWLIDFFHTHRGHVLKDLIKLENDIQYIYGRK